ncbi:MAG TPA: excinuclease ABC subunit A, partial [Pirellulales bacterium]
MAQGFISLRGVEVHNLKGVDLDIPHRKLVVFCGLSGSGKTSLALDTLYAEGQRRYVETFSAYTRQYLQRLERPAAEKITGLPPAVAVTHKSFSRSSRTTVGTATETNDYLRLLFAKIGRVVCQTCGHLVRRESPQSAADALVQLPAETRFLIAFPRRPKARGTADDLANLASELQSSGFVRAVVGDRMINLAEQLLPQAEQFFIVADRLTAGTPINRIRESLEGAFAQGGGQAKVFVDWPEPLQLNGDRRGLPYPLEGRTWQQLSFSNQMVCDECGRAYPAPEPRLYSFNSPLGACPHCEGFGNVVDIDLDLVVPDPRKSLREGAIAPWTTPAYSHELDELIALSTDYAIPLDVPFKNLTEQQLQIIREGAPERNFGGLRGFFAWLERKKYKMHIRVFLTRWRSYRTCPVCNGARLRPEALATQVGGMNIAEVCAMKVCDAIKFFRKLELANWQRTLGRTMLEQVRSRLGFLSAVGLDYLALDRSLRTLSGGESQRVTLTGALGSSLVNMLYVLDEPSIGLHPADTDRLVHCIQKLRDRGNSVCVVEHEESMIRAADQIIEIGPGAGERGGQVVFQGSPQEMEDCPKSLTGDFLAGRRGISPPGDRRRPDHGWIRLAGARGNNLKNITVEFPLGML